MRTIESIDFFYLSMPVIEDIADGSQDALLVRVIAGDQVGWGECEASPLVTIASLVCPMSHSACKPVRVSVLGEPIDSPADVLRIHHQVRRNSMDLLQADHALSGIDIALWDLLGKIHQQPVYRLLGTRRAFSKTPYSSLLFGATPQETLEKARLARQKGFQAVKFGWGSFGLTDLKHDSDQIAAAREGLGQGGILCVDAGTVWGSDFEAAYQRLPALEANQVTWLEEPFHTHALQTYSNLARCSQQVKLAGGEGVHTEYEAMLMIDYAQIGYIQIDAGRIGGITSARQVFQHAQKQGVTFVNHTFTSHLALSASLQVFAGGQNHILCEYPGQLSPMAYELTEQHLLPDEAGQIRLPERPGLGINPNPAAIKKYLVEAELRINGKVLYQTPVL